MKDKELPEVKSLRWLANMFPFTESPKNETDKMSNAIHVYCTAGAKKIEELSNIEDKCLKCKWAGAAYENK